MLPPAAGSANVVVGPELSDDAAVVRLPGPGGADQDGPQLVLTTDTIAPLVDDPETFGRIAAANALSDVYAMGGRPLWALNLVFFPDDRLPLTVLRDIMRGSSQACAEAGVAVVGGHTVRNGDLKFGLAVTGMLEPDARRSLANTRAMPGQQLVLTKALGTGIVASAIKKGVATPEQVDAAVRSMTRLNGEAAHAARRLGATACTDVTGFGLLGHLSNILEGSRLRAELELERLPLLPGALEHLGAGIYPGGSKANLSHVEGRLRRAHASTNNRAFALTHVAADAQTSGGLLVAMPPDGAERLVEALRSSGHPAAIVGELSRADVDEVGVIELRA